MMKKRNFFFPKTPVFFKINDSTLRLIKHNFHFSSAALWRLYSAFRRAYAL